MKISTDIRTKEVKFCPLCGTFGVPFYGGLIDKFYGLPNEWAYLRCAKCGLVWLSSQVIPEDIGKLYDNFYEQSSINTFSFALSLIPKGIKRGILAVAFGYNEAGIKKWQRLVGHLLLWAKSIRESVGTQVMWLDANRKGRILDVGCGSGQFLLQMRDLGWEVVGVEPCLEVARRAREKLGLEVCEATFDSVLFPDNYFDAITMNHVIEHLSNPIDALKKCFRLLKPGGKMVIVTPNIESFGLKFFKKSWQGLDPPRHLYLFSLQTLRTCAGSAMLSIDEMKTTAKGARSFWILSRFIQLYGGIPFYLQRMSSPLLFWWRHLESIFFYVFESLMIKVAPRGRGEEIVMIVSKKKER